MAAKKTTTKVTDLHGNEIEVPLGVDGVSPVSPNNPLPKAVAEEQRDEVVADRKAEIKSAEAQSKAAGTGTKTASTNKEDNTPENRNAETNPNTK